MILSIIISPMLMFTPRWCDPGGRLCCAFTVPLSFQASDLKRHENNMHSERKQLGSLQSDTETLQAAAMAAEEQHLDTISCS